MVTLEEEKKRVENEIEEIKQQSFAWAVLKEQSIANKRWFITLIVIVGLWFATIVGFVWYLNQYDYSSMTEVTVDGKDGGNANYHNGQGDIVNGEGSSKDN